MVIKETRVIPALSQSERKCYVYLPAGYAENPQQRYPVLYAFDGQTVFFDGDAPFGRSLRLGDWLDAHGTQLIVVAIESDPAGNARLEEYAPFDFAVEGMGTFKGRGRRYMEWLAHTLKPAVDAAYRTKKGRQDTFLYGASMGGLMALYGVTAYNRVFGAAVCQSPSLWIDPAASSAMVTGAAMGRPTTVYMDYGSRELANHAANAAVLPAAVQQLLDKGVFLTFRIVPGGTHGEASWAAQTDVFMRELGF